MIDNIENETSATEHEENLHETQDGKAPSPNKLDHQAEPEVAQQVPGEMPESAIKRMPSRGPSNPKKEGNRKRARKRTKDKYREKQLKIKSARINEQPNTVDFINSENNQEDIVDLMEGKENQQEKIDKGERSPIKLTKLSREDECKILSTKGSYFRLEFKKSDFANFVYDTIDDMYKSGEKVKIKRMAIYFIQYLCEEYLEFWFSQLDRISQFAQRKTVMKADFDLYHILINRLLSYDHLSFIKDIIKTSENLQIIEDPKLPELIKSDPPGGVINEKATLEE